MVTEFRGHWKNYVLQSALATLVVFILLWALRPEYLLIVASIGSTAFIVFAMPKSLSARPRNVIGGQIIGLACGTLAHALMPDLYWTQVGGYSLAVGLSMFLMVVTDTEHAPASGTALGIAFRGASVPATLAVVVGAMVLSLVHHLLKNMLRDLA